MSSQRVEGISFSKLIMYENDISKDIETIDNCGTIVVITNKRWFRWSLADLQYSRRIRISENKTFLGRWAAGEKLKFYWVYPPAQTPIPRNKKSPAQYIAQYVKTVLLSEMPHSMKRSEHTIEDSAVKPPRQIQLRRLYLGGSHSYSFEANDGLQVFTLLQQSSLNNGSIPLADTTSTATHGNSGPSDPAERLRQLNRLYEQGLITEQEYQSKRHELLSQI